MLIWSYRRNNNHRSSRRRMIVYMWLVLHVLIDILHTGEASLYDSSLAALAVMMIDSGGIGGR